MCSEKPRFFSENLPGYRDKVAKRENAVGLGGQHSAVYGKTLRKEIGKKIKGIGTVGRFSESKTAVEGNCDDGGWPGGHGVNRFGQIKTKRMNLNETSDDEAIDSDDSEDLGWKEEDGLYVSGIANTAERSEEAFSTDLVQAIISRDGNPNGSPASPNERSGFLGEKNSQASGENANASNSPINGPAQSYLQSLVGEVPSSVSMQPTRFEPKKPFFNYSVASGNDERNLPQQNGRLNTRKQNLKQLREIQAKFVKEAEG